MHDDDQPIKRKVGRPRNPDRALQQKSRRFFMLGKHADVVRLMNIAHATYVRRHGADTTDAEVLRDALREYVKI